MAAWDASALAAIFAAWAQGAVAALATWDALAPAEGGVALAHARAILIRVVYLTRHRARREALAPASRHSSG
jgi:hypothetical protein